MAFESREQIELKYQWDLSSIFASDEAFEAAFDQAKAIPAKLETYQASATQSAQGLLKFLQYHDEINTSMRKLGEYASRKSDEDTRVSKYQGYVAQVMSLIAQVDGAQAWFASDLMALDEQVLNDYFAQEPALEHYRRALQMILRRRPHTLSAAEEALLARAQDFAAQPGQVYALFNDADLTFDDAVDAKGEHHALTHGSFIPMLTSYDRTLRQSAFETLYARYAEFKNTATAMLSAQVKQLKFFADARKYPSSLAYCLDSNEVPVDVYGNLIDAVHNNFDPFYRYMDLRKRVLGVDEQHFWDVYVPLVDEVDMTFTFEEGCEIMLKALAPLGEEYLAQVRRALDERWIDVYETPGKRSGAYSAGGYGMHPIILLNWQGQLDDVFTLVHEMGHSMHTWLSTHTQSETYSEYVLFVAEVASTCNEALLAHYLLETEKDPKRHAYILNHFVDSFRGTLYRQCMFAEFERAVNDMNAQDGGLTADALCERYLELTRLYFGSNITLDEGIRYEWARIPHFYYEYYVYQYSIGFSAAIALSQRILNGGEQEREDYLNYLRGGCSKTPIDLLRGAGVDMSTPDPVNAALAYFDELVGELEQEL